MADAHLPAPRMRILWLAFICASLACTHLHPVNMQTFIDTLDIWRENHSGELFSVDHASTISVYDYPTEVSSDMTGGGNINVTSRDLSSYTSAFLTPANQTRTSNESKITPMDEGATFYHPPGEGKYSESTGANATISNKTPQIDAKQDATALDQALKTPIGRASDGRNIEQILAEMEKYKDAPAYATIYIETYGVDGYLKLPARIQEHYMSSPHSSAANPEEDEKAITAAIAPLGSMLAVSSQPGVAISGSDGKPINLVDAAYAAVTEKGYEGRMPALNAMLKVPDAQYDGTFLADLANRLEHRPYDDQIALNAKTGPGGGNAYLFSSMDPMAGVMTAMGRNPDAAMTYLVPDGEVNSEDGYWDPGEAAQERWNLLSSRDWDPAGGIDGLTAVLGAASSKRVAVEGTEDERAAWITGEAIDFLASWDKERYPGSGTYSDTAKQNIAIIAGNSMQELDDGVGKNRNTRSTPHPSDKNLPAILEEDQFDDLRVLTSIAGTNDEALRIISNAAGRYSKQRTQATLDAYPNAVLGQLGDQDREFGEALNTVAIADGRLIGFISQSAINARTNVATGQANSAETAASTVLGGFGAGVSAIPHPLAQGAGVGISSATPGITTSISRPYVSAIKTADDLATESVRTLLRTMIAQIGNSEHLPSKAYDDQGDLYNYTWITDDSSSDHPTIDIRSVLQNDKYSKQFNEWLNDPNIASSGLIKLFDAGIRDGKRAAL